MSIEQILKVLKNERECIKRQCHKECDRQCGQCDLCLTDEEILEVYDFLIDGYETLLEQGTDTFTIKVKADKVEQNKDETLLAQDTVTFTAKIKSVDGIDKMLGEDKCPYTNKPCEGKNCETCKVEERERKWSI